MSNYDLQPVIDYNADRFLKFVELETNKPGNEFNRYELINGFIYMMSAPKKIHQILSRFIFRAFDNYFRDKLCEAYYAPIDVFLFDNKLFALLELVKSECKNVFEPDILVLCDETKFHDDGIYGAPDLVIEIVSESSVQMDYRMKLYAYSTFGVKEYWVVNPIKNRVTVFDMSNDDLPIYEYTFKDIVKSILFDGLYVDFSQFAPIVDER